MIFGLVTFGHSDNLSVMAETLPWVLEAFLARLPVAACVLYRLTADFAVASEENTLWDPGY